MDSQFKTIIVFSHATMIVILMISLLWASSSLPILRRNTPTMPRGQSSWTHPFIAWP